MGKAERRNEGKSREEEGSDREKKGKQIERKEEIKRIEEGKKR